MISLNGLFYGADGPVASITINDRTGFYELCAVEYMASSYTEASDVAMLNRILAEFQASKYLSLPDITEDVISGQQTFF